MSKVSPLDESALLTTSALRVLERITDPFYALDANGASSMRTRRRSPLRPQVRRGRGAGAVGRLPDHAHPRVPRSPAAGRARAARRDVRSKSPTLERWFEVRCHPCLDGVAVYLRDIDEQKTAEQALRLQYAGAASRGAQAVAARREHRRSPRHPTTTSRRLHLRQRRRGAYPRQVEGRVARALDLGALSRSGGQPLRRDLHQAVAEMRPMTAEFFYGAVGQVVREPHLPEQRWRDRFLQRHHGPQAQGACAGRARTRAARGGPAQGRVPRDARARAAQPARPDPATRRTSHARARRRRCAGHWSTRVIERQVEHMSRLLDDLLDVSRIARGKIAAAHGAGGPRRGASPPASRRRGRSSSARGTLSVDVACRTPLRARSRPDAAGPGV